MEGDKRLVLHTMGMVLRDRWGCPESVKQLVDIQQMHEYEGGCISYIEYWTPENGFAGRKDAW